MSKRAPWRKSMRPDEEAEAVGEALLGLGSEQKAFLLRRVGGQLLSGRRHDLDHAKVLRGKELLVGWKVTPLGIRVAQHIRDAAPDPIPVSNFEDEGPGYHPEGVIS